MILIRKLVATLKSISQYYGRLRSELSHQRFAFMFAAQFGRSHGELIVSLKPISISHTVFFTHFFDTASHANSIIQHIWAHTHIHIITHSHSGATLWPLCDSTVLSFTPVGRSSADYPAYHLATRLACSL